MLKPKNARFRFFVGDMMYRFLSYTVLSTNRTISHSKTLFSGERLVSIAAAPKDFGGERLTSGTKDTNKVASSHGTYSFR